MCRKLTSVFFLVVKKCNTNLVHISINGQQVTHIKCTKILGVYIDEWLNWEEHIKHISSKQSKNIGVLLR